MQITPRLLSIALSLSALSIAACDADPVDMPIEGSGHAVATLRFVNYPGTTVQYLRTEAGITKRQAEAIVAYRDGQDLLPVTPDDHTFDTIRELNLVVDGSVIAGLAATAMERGWLPHQDAFLGTYDGHSFDLSEAELVLDVVNEGTREELDDDAGLHANVVDSIMAGRPFHSLDRVSNLPSLGHVNMSKLKAYALSHGSSSTVPERL